MPTGVVQAQPPAEVRRGLAVQLRAGTLAAPLPGVGLTGLLPTRARSPMGCTPLEAGEGNSCHKGGEGSASQWESPPGP